MNIDWLRSCLAVADDLNFTKAAESCHMAQTAISRQISSLENEIGFRIFERSTRSVALTPAGAQFCRDVRRILAEYDDAVLRAIRTVRNTNGTLVVGMGHFERSFVSALVSSFHALYPNITIHIRQCSYKELLAGLNSGALDIAFAIPHFSVGTDSKYIAEKKLIKSESFLLLNRQDPLATRRLISCEDLSGRTIITTAEAEGPGSLEELKSVLPDNIAVAGFLQTNSTASLFAMLESGLGVAFSQTRFRNELPRSLKAIPLERSMGKKSAGYYSAHYRYDNTNEALRCFLDGLEKEAQKIKL